MSIDAMILLIEAVPGHSIVALTRTKNPVGTGRVWCMRVDDASGKVAAVAHSPSLEQTVHTVYKALYS